MPQENNIKYIDMSGYYTYLISSLPVLHFGVKPPFSFDRFLQMCEGVLSREDINIIKASTEIDGYEGEIKEPALRKWRAFHVTLRNELVKIRSSRVKRDPLKYIRPGGYTDPSITHIAVHAHRTPSIIEAERILDREKWHFLEELETGHYFDIDSVIAYANKLLILQRWHKINTLDKTQALEKILT